MATKKKLTLLQQQKAKLKRQRALTANPQSRQILSQRIQQVQVKIENTQKALTGSKPTKALPPAQTRPTGQPSARRAQAAADQTRAAQGTKGTTTRTANSSNANNLAAARRQMNDPTIKRIVRQASAQQRRGGPLQAVAGIIGNKIIDKATPHIVRGGMKALGINTDNYDKYLRGEPVIKSVNGVDFNVATKAGQRGYQKAVAKRSQSYTKTKTEPTQSSSKPTPTPTQSSSKPTPTPTQSSSKPKPTQSSSRPKTKPDNRSTLTKEIDGLTTFIATHKGKKGMKRALDQAAKRLAEKKKKRGNRSALMSGNTSGSSRSIG